MRDVAVAMYAFFVSIIIESLVEINSVSACRTTHLYLGSFHFVYVGGAPKAKRHSLHDLLLGKPPGVLLFSANGLLDRAKLSLREHARRQKGFGKALPTGTCASRSTGSQEALRRHQLWRSKWENAWRFSEVDRPPPVAVIPRRVKPMPLPQRRE